MKKAKADRILYDVGFWLIRTSGKRTWQSENLCHSRAAARSYKKMRDQAGYHVVIRRCEVFYIGSDQ